jgi:hypothetical protein
MNYYGYLIWTKGTSGMPNVEKSDKKIADLITKFVFSTMKGKNSPLQNVR